MTDTTAKAGVEVTPKSPAGPAASGELSTRTWDPFELHDELYNDFHRLLGHAFALAPSPITLPRHRLAMVPGTWVPSTDVYEQDGSLVVKAELPGLKKEDIEVSLDRDDLVIRGEHKEEHQAHERHFFRVERSYGSFYRRIPLPPEVKADQISASFSNGVLEARIPLPADQTAGKHKIPVS